MRKSFTMAEILLSLTIIGVVAAITLPSLTGNINERTWNTKRKALYSRLSQAISLMPSLNGYGTVNSTTDNAAETFVTSGLSKVLKINNICDNEHLADCGIPNEIIPMGATAKIKTEENNTLAKYFSHFIYTNWPQIDIKAVGFETANGESILAYYQHNCTHKDLEKLDGATNGLSKQVCANFIYDLNGKKGPNTAGKDIGIITVFFPTDSVVVAPLPLGPGNITFNGHNVFRHPNAGAACTKYDSSSRLPNIFELWAINFNNKLFPFGTGGYYWSSSILTTNPSKAWELPADNSVIESLERTRELLVRCIRR